MRFLTIRHRSAAAGDPDGPVLRDYSSVSRISSLAGVPDSEHQNRIVRGPPSIERQISISPLGDDELATSVFHLTPKQWVALQYFNGLANLLNCAQRPRRICLSRELEDALEVSERAGA